MQDPNITPNLRVFSKSEAKIGFTTGKCVGTVDYVDGDRYIKLKKNGSPDGKHHWIPSNWVTRVDDKSIHLHKTQDEVWRDCLNAPPESQTEKKVIQTESNESNRKVKDYEFTQSTESRSSGNEAPMDTD